MSKRTRKVFLIPAAMVLGVSVGAVGGAVAVDHLAARYLWPEPEDLVVPQTVASTDPVEPPAWESAAH